MDNTREIPFFDFYGERRHTPEERQVLAIYNEAQEAGQNPTCAILAQVDYAALDRISGRLGSATFRSGLSDSQRSEIKGDEQKVNSAINEYARLGQPVTAIAALAGFALGAIIVSPWAQFSPGEKIREPHAYNVTVYEKVTITDTSSTPEVHRASAANPYSEDFALTGKEASLNREAAKGILQDVVQRQATINKVTITGEASDEPLLGKGEGGNEQLALKRGQAGWEAMVAEARAKGVKLPAFKPESPNNKVIIKGKERVLNPDNRQQLDSLAQAGGMTTAEYIRVYSTTKDVQAFTQRFGSKATTFMQKFFDRKVTFRMNLSVPKTVKHTEMREVVKQKEIAGISALTLQLISGGVFGIGNVIISKTRTSTSRFRRRFVQRRARRLLAKQQRA